MIDVDVARQLGIAICEAWGLDARDVMAIDLRWRPHEHPVATIELRATEGVVREMLRLSVVERIAEVES